MIIQVFLKVFILEKNLRLPQQYGLEESGK